VPTLRGERQGYRKKNWFQPQRVDRIFFFLSSTFRGPFHRDKAAET